MKSFFFLSVALMTASAHAQSFRDGDVYVVSASLPKPPNLSEPGVLRVEPGTWQTTKIYTGPEALLGRATYDPFRDRLVMADQGTGLMLLAADGTTSSIPTSGGDGKRFPTATGDGRIYYVADGGSTLDPIVYLDADNVQHNVLNPGGAGNATINTAAMQAFHFDPGTGSLLVGVPAGAGLFSVERITLNPAGNEVVSRTTATGTLGGASSGEIKGFSAGPNGRVFIKIDNNDSNTRPRMQLMDVAALTFSTFASSGYTGAGGEVGGAYVPAIERAVVIDTLNDKLRVFGLGESGPGQIVAHDVSSTGSASELVQIVPIVTPGCPADFDGDGFVTGDDFDQYVAAFESGDPTADFNGDGFVTGDDFDGYVVAFEAGC